VERTGATRARHGRGRRGARGPLLGAILALAVLAAGAPGAGQSPAARVAYLAAAGRFDPFEQALVAGLRDLGYIEGQNLAIEFRFADGRADRLPELAREIVQRRPDVIVTPGQNVARAVQRETDSIPIVVVAMPDPVAAGLVTSLARPGGHVTGLSFMSAELDQKRLALLAEAVPSARRVALVVNPDTPTGAIRRRETEEAARALGVHVQLLAVRRPEDVDAAFQAADRERIDALLVARDFVTESQRTRIVELAARRGLPAMYEQRDFVEAGGLMSYGPSLPQLFRRAAGYVDRILRGARPGDLPIEQPTRFELLVNLRAATALGLALPPAILARTDQVLQ
jgi:putative ABC transport system substrate-binding protein